MRTPQEYTDNLKNGIVTEEMLSLCLYSLNKRAKNWRDAKRKSREYRGYTRYDNYERAEAEEEKYYRKKEELLGYIRPLCIHKEFAGYDRQRVYDYQKNYDRLWVEHALAGDIVWENSYIDRSVGCDDEYYDFGTGRVVSFFDYNKHDCPRFRYYLYYECGNFSFHTPIHSSDLRSFPDLPQITIDHIVTYGDNTDQLLSVQFTQKVLTALKNEAKYTGDVSDADMAEKRRIYRNQHENLFEIPAPCSKEAGEEYITDCMDEISDIMMKYIRNQYFPDLDQKVEERVKKINREDINRNCLYLQKKELETKNRMIQIRDEIKKSIPKNFSSWKHPVRSCERIRRRIKKNFYKAEECRLVIPDEVLISLCGTGYDFEALCEQAAEGIDIEGYIDTAVRNHIWKQTYTRKAAGWKEEIFGEILRSLPN